MAEGVAFFNAARFAEALERFGAARAAGRDDAEVGLYEAHGLHAAGRAADALARLRELAERFPDEAAVRLGLASVLRLERRDAEAAAELARGLARLPGEPRLTASLLELRRARALALKTEGAGERTAAAWKAVLELAPADAEALAEVSEERARTALARARAEREAGREPRAAAILRRALAAGASKALLEAELAELARREQKPAADEFGILLARARREREAGRFSRARALLAPRAAESEEARRELEAIAVARASDLATKRRWAQAERAVAEVAGGDCQDPVPPALVLAECRLRRGDDAGARKALERALAASREAKGLPGRLSRFRLLVALGRYPEAFAEAEAALDEGPDLAAMRVFWYPWTAGLLQVQRDRHRALLESLCDGKPATPWPLYLSGFVDSDGAALPRLLSARAYPAARYGWMRFKLGWALLHAARFEEAALELEAAARRKDADWRAYGFLAETLLCLGRRKDAFAALEAGGRLAPASEKPEPEAWRGALELWLGNYAKARARLDRAVEGGARWALVWRAAARLKLGDAEGALEDLSHAPADDGEAPVWRSEALLALGRAREAAAAVSGRAGLWAAVARGRAHAAAGRRDLARREFESLPEPVKRRLAAAAGLEGRPVLSDAQIGGQLEKAIALARGFRCERSYGNVIWMR